MVASGRARGRVAGRARRPLADPSGLHGYSGYQMRKTYVLDANILLHDPQSIFHFADNDVVIPVGVIRELDRFKKEATSRGYNARQAVRLLDGLRRRRALSQGVPLPGGGSVRVVLDVRSGNGRWGADDEILQVAQKLCEQGRARPVVIVTKDIALRIRADAAGLRAEDYASDRVNPQDLYTGQVEHVVPASTVAAFRASGVIKLPELRLVPNEYVHLRAEDGRPRSALGRADAEARHVERLRHAGELLCGIRPRNKEQYFAIDALLDERLRLVTLMGKAGTGKTLLAIAAAMHLVLRRGRYRSVLVCRPVVPLGRDLGFLPGDVSQKLDPWMKPVLDTIEFLIDVGGPLRGQRDAVALLRSGLIELQPLAYIRGRSISNRFVIIDEAQNLTPLEVKTIITRMGPQAKVVLTGDPYQIDNPYVDTTSNGFCYLVNRFRSQAIAAHVELRKGERSDLAELAAELL